MGGREDGVQEGSEEVRRVGAGLREEEGNWRRCVIVLYPRLQYRKCLYVWQLDKCAHFGASWQRGRKRGDRIGQVEAATKWNRKHVGT